MPGQKLTTSAEHGRAARARYAAALVVGLAGVFWWLSQLPEAQPIQPASDLHGSPPNAVAATAAGSADGDALAQTHLRQPAKVADQPAANEQWTVQLTGVNPDKPWTAPLRITFEGRLEVTGDVDEQGACTFVPPSGARNVGMQHMQVAGRDPNYRITRRDYRAATLQNTGYMEVRVEAVANFRGRVTSPHGVGISARIRGFPHSRRGPREPLLARTQSRPDGYYELQVPIGVQMLIVADATTERISPLGDATQGSFVFTNSARPDHERLEDVHFHDSRQPRAELLPASLETEPASQGARDLPDLQLGATSYITGRVTFANGQPLADAIVSATPTNTPGRAWHGRLHWSNSHSVLTGTWTRTDSRGEYTLHLQPGVAFRVQAMSEQPLLLAGEPSTEATAPGIVNLRAPGDLLTIRVTMNGKPLPHAKVQVVISEYQTDAQGTLQATFSRNPLVLRAVHEASQSAWFTLPARNRPEAIELKVIERHHPIVRINLTSKPTVRDAMFNWRPLPHGTAISLTKHRANGDVPFEMNIAAGDYELSIHDIPDAPGGAYLLPARQNVTVPEGGLVIDRDLAFGGTIAIDMHAASGIRIGGRFTLVNAAGKDVTPQTMAWDSAGNVRIAETGQLQNISRNRLTAVFPPGTYTLTVTTITRGTVTRTVRVGPRANTNVPIVLR